MMHSYASTSQDSKKEDSIHSQIVVLNSDNSIAKYHSVSREFNTIMEQHNIRLVNIDLAESSIKDTRIYELINQKETKVVYCIGSKAYGLAQKAHANKHIIFSSVINWSRFPVKDGSTGISSELGPAHEISLIKYFFPDVRKFGILYDESYNLQRVKQIREEANALGIDTLPIKITPGDSVLNALNKLTTKIDLFWLISDPTLLASNRSVQSIFNWSKKNAIPVYSYGDVFIKYGAVLSISVDEDTVGRQAANLAIRFITEQNSNIPIQKPAGSKISINLCRIEQYATPLNEKALGSVNRMKTCSGKF